MEDKELIQATMDSYHQGYLLALDDLERDINTMIRSGNFSLERVRMTIHDSRDQVNYSRDTLHKLKERAL